MHAARMHAARMHAAASFERGLLIDEGTERDKSLAVIAAEYGQVRILRLLLKFGAMVNPEGSDEQLKQIMSESLKINALAAAAANNQIECLDILTSICDINELGITCSSIDHKDHFIHRYSALIEAIAKHTEPAI
jgi:hypothetical protein